MSREGGKTPAKNQPPRLRPGEGKTESLSDYIKGLPPGTRSHEDIDRQVREERDAW